jgi:putative PIN family toxin of toxin-antitoxin system
MKVVLDTNVLISAIVFGGKPRKILEAVFRGELTLFLSEYILDELEAVLKRPKFGFPSEVIQTILSELHAICTFVTPSERILEIQEDPDDNRIFECAVEASANYIISGDTHLLNLKQYQNVRIVSPDKYLAIRYDTENQ